uniref:Uncharacterized protein n=1 Tax=Pelusios castaneus TaxID=367368 RepID=A0A8C8RF84_9SAUR
MASATPVQAIQEETKCPICLEYLTDPVTMHCGHNFCRVCITQHCDTWTQGDYGTLRCPSCRDPIQRGSLRNNRQLANIVEKIKDLGFKQGTGNLCGRHNRALDLFCEEDWEAVCVVCWRSPEHRSHTVLLREEAAQKYKEKVQSHLKALREEREKILGFKLTAEEKCRQYLKQTQTERQKIVSEFQQWQQFLEEQQQLMLAKLEKLEKEMVMIQTENITKLSVEISRLSELIREMEGKCQKPTNEFLQVRRKFQQPVQISPELENRLRNFSQKTIALMDNLWKSKVTLDPDTAHPFLVLSADGKHLTLFPVCWAVRDSPRGDIAGRWRWRMGYIGLWGWPESLWGGREGSAFTLRGESGLWGAGSPAGSGCIWTVTGGR